jgi:hypothetical protein
MNETERELIENVACAHSRHMANQVQAVIEQRDALGLALSALVTTLELGPIPDHVQRAYSQALKQVGQPWQQQQPATSQPSQR